MMRKLHAPLLIKLLRPRTLQHRINYHEVENQKKILVLWSIAPSVIIEGFNQWFWEWESTPLAKEQFQRYNMRISNRFKLKDPVPIFYWSSLLLKVRTASRCRTIFSSASTARAGAIFFVLLYKLALSAKTDAYQVACVSAWCIG